MSGVSGVTSPHFLRPRRAELTRLRSLLDGAVDANGGWQRLLDAGAVPPPTLARAFVREPEPGAPRVRDPLYTEHAGQPTTLEGCLAFAADAAAIPGVESAALALTERLATWGAARCERVLWWSIDREQFTHVSTDTRPGVVYSLLAAANALHAHVPTLPPLWGHATEWARAWDRHLRARHPANPFEPLAAIEAAGYTTLEYTGPASRGGAVILVTPHLDA